MHLSYERALVLKSKNHVKTNTKNLLNSKISKTYRDGIYMIDENYFRKYARYHFRRNIIKHDNFLPNNKNLPIHYHLSPVRL